jgi:hypothetical protein
MIDNVTMIGFTIEDFRALITLRLFDDYNFQQLEIVNNELIAVSDAYDLSFVGPTFTIREGPGRVLAELRFDTSANLVSFVRGELKYNGVRWVVRQNEQITVPVQDRGTSTLGGHVTFRAPLEVGVGLGLCSPNLRIGARIPAINRYDYSPEPRPR